MEKVAVNLMNGPQGSTLTILEGQALELKHPERLILTGRIESVRQYLDARRATQQPAGSLQHIDKDKAVIIVNEDDLSIHLEVDPNNPFGTEITGKMQNNPDLLQFNINKTARFSRESLIELLKFNRRFFPDRVEWDNILRSIQKLSVSTTSNITQENDSRGNKENSFKKQVDSASIPSSFKLQIPLFKGQLPRTFTVDLCLDVTDAGIKIFLESVELIELVERDRKEIIQKELAEYIDYCIIWK